MKKPKTADVVMVLIIVLILVGGVLLALHLTADEEIPFGTAYRITPIPGDVLPSEEGGTNRCTLTIRCDTILQNADSLLESKIPYVPEDGAILGEITVEFQEGETAFDVLKRACEAADIQLEYS